MKKRTNLTRMDHEGCKGWWVRIQRGDKQVSKLFSDGVYGGNKRAEAAAIKFRDEQLKKLPKRIYKGSSGPRKSAAGYYLRTRLRRGKEEKAWVAIWTEDGRQMEKSFSINQHGHASAKKLAKEHRQAMVAQLLAVPADPAPAKGKKGVASKTTAKKKTGAKRKATAAGRKAKAAPKKTARKKVKKKPRR